MPSPMRRPIAVDLFCGAGGLSYGLEAAGFEVMAGVELEAVHAGVHEFNFGVGRTICADISTLSADDIRRRTRIGDREVTLVAGGPPCQGISHMGKRAIDDPRNALLREFVRVATGLRPRFIIMENVAGLLSGEHVKLLDEVADDLEAAGYAVRRPFQVLQATQFGTPQSRKRLFVLAARHGEVLPNYPEPTHTSRRIDGSPVMVRDGLPLGPSVADALFDLPNAEDYPDLARTDVVSATFGEPSAYAAALRRHVRTSGWNPIPRMPMPGLLTSSMTTNHSPASRARFAATEPGATERVSRFLRLHPDGVANTLRAGTNSTRGGHTAARPIHPLFPRVITVREAARLHGYPDVFRFAPTKWSGFREVGNSVPIPLGHAVAREVMAVSGYDNAAPRAAMPRQDTALLYSSARQVAAMLEKRSGG